MATLKMSVRLDVSRTLELREQPTGSVDLIVKGTDANGKARRARIVRVLGARNKPGKVGTLHFGRKGAILRALGFQTVDGRVAFAA